MGIFVKLLQKQEQPRVAVGPGNER